jgi:thymidylate synthase (FAD)
MQEYSFCRNAEGVRGFYLMQTCSLFSVVPSPRTPLTLSQDEAKRRYCINKDERMPDFDPAHDIKIIREPAVYVLGRQTVHDAEIDRFLSDHRVSWHTDTEVAGEHLVETAGRICYMSFAKPRPGGNQAYIGHILQVGHGSVLEHAVWNLLFTGVSRSLTHELIRHRAGFGYSQLSQRYVDESIAEYVEPDCIADDPELHRLWLDAVADMHKAYLRLTEKLLRVFESEPDKTLRRKLARQAARSVLPNATETKIFVTANARALRHFIELRGNRHAETEIRKLAIAVLKIMQQEAPNLFGDYQLVPLPDGTFEAMTEHRKV